MSEEVGARTPPTKDQYLAGLKTVGTAEATKAAALGKHFGATLDEVKAALVEGVNAAK